MLFGGWLYPDAASTGVTGTEDSLDRDEFGCAAMGIDVAQATSAATNRQFKAFRTGMGSLRFNSRAKTDIDDTLAKFPLQQQHPCLMFLSLRL